MGADGYAHTYDPDGSNGGPKRSIFRTNTGDTLSYEVNQRPTVRGSLSDTAPAAEWSREDIGDDRHVEVDPDGRYTQNGKHRDGQHTADPMRQYEGRTREHDGRIEQHPTATKSVSANEAFVSSLRSGEPVEEDSARRTPRRKPDWNSDTTGAASLGDPWTRHMTDNSSAAVEVNTIGTNEFVISLAQDKEYLVLHEYFPIECIYGR